MSNRRFTMKRVDAKPSPYVDEALIHKYANETFLAILAPADVQVLLLELSYGEGALD
jgi:hypothetical protein